MFKKIRQLFGKPETSTPPGDDRSPAANAPPSTSQPADADGTVDPEHTVDPDHGDAREVRTRLGDARANGNGVRNTIETERIGSVYVATFTDSQILGHHRIRNTSYALADLVGDSVRAVVLDFCRVEFMSSAMLAKLIMIRKRCSNHGVDLRLCSLSPNLYEIFMVTRLSELFEIDRDRTAALARLLAPEGFPTPASEADWQVCADWWEEQGDETVARACREEARRSST